MRSARVETDGAVIGQIGIGLLAFLGIHATDVSADVAWLCRKIPRLRIFDDADGRMNLSLLESHSELLVVSQFTLFGSTRKGNRPSFNDAARPELAESLYQDFLTSITDELGRPIATGRFGAMMRIFAENDGPVTLMLDSRLRE